MYEKPRSLKVRHYTARLIDVNEYLTSFIGATIADKIGITELNKLFQTVCITADLSKRMFRTFIASLFCLKIRKHV